MKSFGQVLLSDANKNLTMPFPEIEVFASIVQLEEKAELQY